MKPRAFVVMPYGKKHPVEIQTRDNSYEARTRSEEVDFNAVYNSLIEPALRNAGCEPFRADCEAAAGDIRTDMYFELVTADLVIADLSISNPNVFYELGVRHGVCSRGVFVIQGNWGNSRPFDVAPDRSFTYDGSLFLTGSAVAQQELKDAGEIQRRLREEVDRLTQIFKHAIASEPLTIGSPVYEHLPGLEPVKWDNIQTSKARFFGALRDDWLDCVRLAQSKGHPGDILTLAEDAPTRAHRTKILYEAALALIDLCRYPAAEQVLREVIQEDANHADAQVHLGLVLAQQGKTAQAEHQLRTILGRHHEHPHASDLLGQVFRYLWHLSWRDEPDETRKQKAVDTSHLAASAVRSFLHAQQADPRAYFAGFNALILMALLEHLQKSTGGEIAEALPNDQNKTFEDLRTVIRFCANNCRDRALERGDYVAQFWTTTTLSGVALIDGNESKALQRVREACSIPGATFFQLHSFRERLRLLEALEFRPEFVTPALAVIEEAFVLKNRHCTCERVFLWSRCEADLPGAAADRFPRENIAAVGERIDEALESWKVGKNDLAICEGMHESDILFAEACYRRGARVRLMLLDPMAHHLDQPLWAFRPAELEQRFHDLRAAGGNEVWFHSDHLGPPPFPFLSQTSRNTIRRHKRWLLHTARMEAEPALSAAPRSETESNNGSWGRLFGLFLRRGDAAGDDPEDGSYFVRLVNEFNSYQGQVRIISSLEPEKQKLAIA